jgi:hypothetical protein
MMGVAAYRQLLRTSKMRTSGAPAPEESAVALQHVSRTADISRICCSALCSKRLLLIRSVAVAQHPTPLLTGALSSPPLPSTLQAKERIMVRLASQADRVQRDPRRAFSRLRDQACLLPGPNMGVLLRRQYGCAVL